MIARGALAGSKKERDLWFTAKSLDLPNSEERMGLDFTVMLMERQQQQE